MFLSPAVTPWKSTLEGVGANNPSIRLYHYNKDDGVIQKYKQFYLNLTAANLAGSPLPNWELEYDTSVAYGLDELRAGKFHDLAQAFSIKKNELFRRYLDFNSVKWNTSEECNGTCFRRHLCAITELDLDNYRICMSGGQTSLRPHTNTPQTIQNVPGYLYYVIGGLGGAVFLLFLVVTFLCYNKLGRNALQRYKKFGTKSVNSHDA